MLVGVRPAARQTCQRPVSRTIGNPLIAILGRSAGTLPGRRRSTKLACCQKRS